VRVGLASFQFPGAGMGTRMAGLRRGWRSDSVLTSALVMIASPSTPDLS
jgi:hypothetical protein